MAAPKKEVNEQSSAIIRYTLFDEKGFPRPPRAGATWTLIDAFKNLISTGDLDQQETNEVALTGAALAIQSLSDKGRRFFTVKGKYDSDKGILDFTDELEFWVKDLKGVS